MIARRFTGVLIVVALALIIPVIVSAQTKKGRTPLDADGLYDQGVEFVRQGNDKEAILSFTRAIGKKPDHPLAYWRRGLIYQKQKKYTLAMADFKKSIRSMPDFADSHGSLCWLLIEQGKFAEAKPYCEKAHALDPDCYEYTAHLGHIFLMTGNSSRAHEYYRETLSRIEKNSELDRTLADFDLFIKNGWKITESMKEKEWMREGWDRLVEASSLSDKAAGLGKERRYAEAISLLREALTIKEPILPPGHTDIAVTCARLADLYMVTCYYAEAEPLYTRTLAIYEKAYNERNKKTMSLAEAIILPFTLLSRSILGTSEKPRGVNPLTIAFTCNNLAEIYRTTGRYAEAESMYKKALGVYERTGRKDHADVATTCKNLAGLYKEMDRPAEGNALPESCRTRKDTSR